MTELFENTLYANQTEKDELLKDKKHVATLFWINTLGFFAIQKSQKDKAVFKPFFKGIDKTRINQIDDVSHDVASALKLANEAKMLPIAFITEFTKLLYILKIKPDTDIDENKLRELFKKIVLANIIPDTRIYIHVKAWLDGTEQLDSMLFPLFYYAKYKKNSLDFQRYIKYFYSDFSRRAIELRAQLAADAVGNVVPTKPKYASVTVSNDPITSQHVTPVVTVIVPPDPVKTILDNLKLTDINKMGSFVYELCFYYKSSKKVMNYLLSLGKKSDIKSKFESWTTFRDFADPLTSVLKLTDLKIEELCIYEYIKIIEALSLRTAVRSDAFRPIRNISINIGSNDSIILNVLKDNGYNAFFAKILSKYYENNPSKFKDLPDNIDLNSLIGPSHSLQQTYLTELITYPLLIKTNNGIEFLKFLFTSEKSILYLDQDKRKSIIKQLNAAVPDINLSKLDLFSDYFDSSKEELFEIFLSGSGKKKAEVSNLISSYDDIKVFFQDYPDLENVLWEYIKKHQISVYFLNHPDFYKSMLIDILLKSEVSQDPIMSKYLQECINAVDVLLNNKKIASWFAYQYDNARKTTRMQYYMKYYYDASNTNRYSVDLECIIASCIFGSFKDKFAEDVKKVPISTLNYYFLPYIKKISDMLGQTQIITTAILKDAIEAGFNVFNSPLIKEEYFSPGGLMYFDEQFLGKLNSPTSTINMNSRILPNIENYDADTKKAILSKLKENDNLSIDDTSQVKFLLKYKDEIALNDDMFEKIIKKSRIFMPSIQAMTDDPKYYVKALEVLASDRKLFGDNIKGNMKYKQFIEELHVPHIFNKLKDDTTLTEFTKQSMFDKIIYILGNDPKNKVVQENYVTNLILETLAIKQSLNDVNQNSAIPILKTVTDEEVEAILKFNNFTLKDSGNMIKYNRAKDPSPYKFLKKNEKAKITLPPCKVSKLNENDDELLRKTVEYTKYYNNNHGTNGIQFLESFDVDLSSAQLDEFMKNNPTPNVIPAFHGTGSIAASMILRFGFKILTSSVGGVQITGKMLGNGVYFSNIISKAMQYLGDDGYNRTVGTVGYLFEMDAYIGENGKDHDKAGINGRDAIRSPEWCVYNPRAQLHIRKTHKVKIINGEQITRLKNQFPDALKEDKYFGRFKNYLKEEYSSREATTFVFYQGLIPVGDEFVEFDKFELKANMQVGFGQLGPEITVFGTKDSKTIMIPNIDEFKRDDPEEFYSLWKKLNT